MFTLAHSTVSWWGGLVELLEVPLPFFREISCLTYNCVTVGSDRGQNPVAHEQDWIPPPVLPGNKLF